MGYRIAVVGATGNVGREILNILAERQFPADEVAAVASALINLPSGRIILTGRNVPSLAGSPVAIKYLNATRTQVRPPP